MAERKIRKVMYGNTERHSFAQVDEVIGMPNLIEVQKKSYNDFLERGIGEVFRDFSPITDFSGRIEPRTRLSCNRISDSLKRISFNSFMVICFLSLRY